jgi:transposase-like protein
MPGRLPASNFIIPVEDILHTEVLSHEIWNLSTLLPLIATPKDTMNWCAERKLLRNSMDCHSCHNLCGLVKDKNSIDGYRWVCRNCGNLNRSIRTDSFFSRSHLSLRQILFIMYWWAAEHSQRSLLMELSISKVTVIDWNNFCRDICISWNSKNPIEIGGQSEDGSPIIIEMDETVIFKPKYNRGRVPTTRWLFGAIERSTGKCFMECVRNRKAETLLPIIAKHCLPGSRLITDGFSSYFTLDTVYGGIYQHDSVIHKFNFVDPGDNDIHTQTIESTWSVLKRGSKIRKGTHSSVLSSYIHEFLWRRNFVCKRNAFSCLLLCIREDYCI